MVVRTDMSTTRDHSVAGKIVEILTGMTAGHGRILLVLALSMCGIFIIAPSETTKKMSFIAGDVSGDPVSINRSVAAGMFMTLSIVMVAMGVVMMISSDDHTLCHKHVGHSYLCTHHSNDHASHGDTYQGRVPLGVLHESIVASMQKIGVEFVAVDHGKYNASQCGYWLTMLSTLQLNDTRTTDETKASDDAGVPSSTAESKLQGPTAVIPSWYRDEHDDRYRTGYWPNGYRLKCVWQNCLEQELPFVFHIIWLPHQRLVETQILVNPKFVAEINGNPDDLRRTHILNDQWKHMIDLSHQLCALHVPTMALDAKWRMAMSWSIDKERLVDLETVHSVHDGIPKRTRLCTSKTCKTNVDTIKQMHEILASFQVDKWQAKLMSLDIRVSFAISCDRKVWVEKPGTLHSSCTSLLDGGDVIERATFDPLISGSGMRMWRELMNRYGLDTSRASLRARPLAPSSLLSATTLTSAAIHVQSPCA